MDDRSLPQSGLPLEIKSRSMGMKLIVVCGLALFMTIPALLSEDWLERGPGKRRTW